MSYRCNRCRRSNVRQDICEAVDKQEFNGSEDRKVIKHEYIVKHKHDIVHEYDIIHEHDYNYYNVVRDCEVSKENDYTTSLPNFCCDQECECID